MLAGCLQLLVADDVEEGVLLVSVVRLDLVLLGRRDGLRLVVVLAAAVLRPVLLVEVAEVGGCFSSCAASPALQFQAWSCKKYSTNQQMG